MRTVKGVKSAIFCIWSVGMLCSIFGRTDMHEKADVAVHLKIDEIALELAHM
jgi:hypothetical protein